MKSRFYFYRTAPVKNRACSGVHEHVSKDNEPHIALDCLCKDLEKRLNIRADRVPVVAFNRV